MQWGQAGKNRTYTFAYDNLSRLKSATYSGDGNFNTSYTYDKHGNIKTLQRYGLTTSTTYGLIDNLTAEYTGNQLKYVSDAVNNFALGTSLDFKEYTKGTNSEYTYNKNGAMAYDLNKGISQIQYNYLNLPQIVDIKNQSVEGRNEYTYSASGQKLKVVQKWNPNYNNSPVIGSAVNTSLLTQATTTDYVGNIIYENGLLKRILVEGGYYEGGNYYFYIRDHLGNNRIVANAAASVVQSTQYYPFGMPFADATGQNIQPYKYNDKELDTRNGLNMYDYSARYMDFAFPHFPTVDPLAEKYYSWSPYAYCLNNPIKYIDPDGCSTHTDSLGHVVAVYNDGNMGVFKHNINASKYDGAKLSVKNGVNMGETEYWDEFLPGFSPNGDGFTIQFGKSFDGVIEQMHEKASSMDLREIAAHSAGGGLFDIKKDYPGVGRLLNGKYVSSRSAGNYLAGYNASEGTYFGVSVSFETFQKLAGALHIEESAGRRLSNTQKAQIVIFGTYNSSNPNKFKAPTWGEIPYQYRMSKKGWNHGK